MKLSISNIGWSCEHDLTVYDFMKKHGYSGLEIAPTRIFSQEPYSRSKAARIWSKNLKKVYGLSISSIQSIWYGRQERLFGSEKERQVLMMYTKRAIDFAKAIGCKNLVFGCPCNRVMPNGFDTAIGISFFKELGDYAAAHGTVIGMEANPPIYNTNYINDTLSALQLIRQVGSRGFLLNLDVGTMVQNNEEVYELIGNVNLINHVHISEPGLKPIEERALHKELNKILVDGKYEGFVSIEMGMVEEISMIKSRMQYVRSIFQ